MVIWSAFLLLTALHIWANYKALTCLTIFTLNRSRFHIMAAHYMTTRTVLTPREACSIEGVGLVPVDVSLHVVLGARLKHIANTQAQLIELFDMYEKGLLMFFFNS